MIGVTMLVRSVKSHSFHVSNAESTSKHCPGRAVAHGREVPPHHCSWGEPVVPSSTTEVSSTLFRTATLPLFCITLPARFGDYSGRECIICQCVEFVMKSVLVGKSLVFFSGHPTVLFLANTSTVATFRRRSDEDLFLSQGVFFEVWLQTWFFLSLKLGSL